MDEHKQKATDYVVQQLRAGIPADTIVEHLRAANWPENYIAEAFQTAQQQFAPQQYQTAPAPQPVTQESVQPQQPQAQETTSQPLQPAAKPSAIPTKKGRIRTGWLLFKQTMTILKGNKQLLRYLLMTTLWVTVITVVLVVLYMVFDKKDLQKTGNKTLSPLGYALGFADYLLVYFFIYYYAAGLTANILDIFQGNQRSYAEYMKIARAKIGPIFVFSLLSATIGFILQYVVERIRFAGWLISWILGTLWSLGTLFVIPLIVDSENPNGVTEIKRSAGLFKQTWGENITAKVSVNAPLFLINILLVVIYLVLIFPVAVALGWVGIVLLTVLFLVAIFLLSLIGSYANSAVNVALYYYAVHNQVPPAFDAELLNRVFITRKRRRFFGKKDPA